VVDNPPFGDHPNPVEILVCHYPEKMEIYCSFIS
jgi:hypothetical protein